MTILDRYFTKQLLFPIFFCALTLVFLVFMADLFDNLDEMLRNKTGFLFILKYYLALLPETFVAIISWASLLGAIYVLTTFNFHNEITAMKVAGLEITAIIRPILFLGFILGILTFLISDRIVPYSSQVADQIKVEKIQKRGQKKLSETTYHNVTHYGGFNRLYYAREFNTDDQLITDLIILWLNSDRGVKRKTIAREAQWAGEVWELRQVTEYNLTATGEIIGEPTYAESLAYPEINESPEEFVRAASEGTAISYQNLKEYIKQLKENGVKLTTEPVTLHYKLAAPWNSLLVMFLAIPFLAQSSTRRLIAVNVLFCLGFVFLFHTTGAVILALGQAGKLFPVVSAWAHSLIFGFGTFFFLDRANL